MTTQSNQSETAKSSHNHVDNHYLPATCQHCLADSNHTTLSPHKDRRCPVCGADYTGPRRSKEFRLLVEAGLVARDG